MNKSFIVTAVVLICLIVGTILCIQSFLKEDPAPTPTPEASVQPPEQTPTPTPEETPTPTPIPTPPPRPTPTPTPTPAPTPTPVPAEKSGSFRSDTGTGLNILVEWNAYPAASGYQLDVEVSAVSYGFYTDALYDSVNITVDGKSFSLTSPAVRYDGKDQIVTPLAVQSVNVESGSVPISVVWNYKGTYSGVELESIAASGTASLS